MIVNKYKGNGGGGGDMSNYYTKAQTNALVSGATEDLASEEYVDEALSGLTEDIPTAQDGSDVKQYVYCATGTTTDERNKNIVSSVDISGSITSTKGLRITIKGKKWGNPSSTTSSSLDQRTGDITRPGLKTLRDSAIINSAEEALAGFDMEEITLTLGDVSEVDYVIGKFNSQSNQTRYLYETDDDRYEVLPLSGFTALDNITSFVIDNTTLYPYNFFDLPMGGEKLQLETYTGNLGRLAFTNIGGQDYYLIIDKELLTLSVTDSLTITRTKSIAEAISGSTPDVDVLDQVVSAALVDLNEKKVESEDIKHIVKLTQAEYDQLATKDPETFYIIITNNN